MLTASRLLAGRYRLLEPVGEGGMAIVHRARDELLGRDVAVKLLRPIQAADPDFVRRFRREARHAAQLHHPNVVTIHDLGVDEATGADYIVMQLVDGPTLETMLAGSQALPVGQALRIGSEVAQALQAAHDQGIVHRDVKPGNILIDRDGSARVADFGIARAAGAAGVTTAGVVVGSPQYVSPEQVLGEPITPASDVYSLGVVLYEMVTGRRPFDGPSAAAIALQRLRLDPPAPSSIAADLPPGLDDVIRRAMARDPVHRIPSAAELSIALDGIRLVHLGGVRRSGSRARPADPDEAPGEFGAASTLPEMRPAVEADEDPPVEITPMAAAASVAPAAVRTAPGHPRPRVKGRLDRRRRRTRSVAGLLPLVVLAAVVLGAVGLLARERTGPGRDGGMPPSGAGVPTARPSDPPVAIGPAASPTPSPSVATPSPTDTLATPAPPTPRPTPRPRTPAPTPTVTPRPATTRTPAETVQAFYVLVARHDFDAAARLWSASMRERYPPAQYIDGRFAATTAIDVRRAETVARTDTTARVAVDLIEYRSDATTRHWVGSWDLVRTSAGWLMDQPHF